MKSGQMGQVTLAYEWVRAYFEEISAVCARAILGFERRGYSRAGSEVNWSAHAHTAAWEEWLPPWQYLFFEPVDGTSRLAVLFNHYEAGQPEPTIYLLRFADQNLKQLDIVRNFDVADPDGPGPWYEAAWQETPYSWRQLPVGAIETLNLVDTMIVEPLVSRDRGAAA